MLALENGSFVAEYAKKHRVGQGLVGAKIGATWQYSLAKG